MIAFPDQQDNGEPELVRLVKMSEVLNEEQLARVSEIIASAAKNRASSQQLVQALKDYLSTISKQLEELKIDSDYLAYWIVALVT
jgi:hypothetical protein